MMPKTKKPTIADFLKPYGVETFQEFYLILRNAQSRPYNDRYAKWVYTGRKPVSKRVARAIRDYTKGGLSLDLLLGLGQENGR